MKTREIILRTSGAIVLALTMVLIPLSQAEALPACSSLASGESASECSWSECGDSFDVGNFTIKQYYEVTITRVDNYSGKAVPREYELTPICIENSACSCIRRFYNY